MRSWDELVSFIRGTRPRPPPGPSQPLASVLLACAAILHLPLVYAMVAAVALAPLWTILVGLVTMGLTWCAGVSLEGRRLGTVRWIAAAGVAEGALALVPVVDDALGSLRWALAATALLCASALVVVGLSRPGSRPS